MDVMVEGRDSRMNGDFGNEDEEFDLDLFHFWDFPMENVSGDDYFGDWDESNLERLGPTALDASTPPTIQCRKVDTFPVAAQSVEPHKPKPLPDYVGIAFGSCVLDRNASTETRESGALQMQSPGSVVESRSSCLTGFFGAIPGQPRSRRVETRPRLKPWNLMSPWHSAKPGTSNYRKNKGWKKLSGDSVYSLQSSDSAEQPNYSLLRSGATKKCTHCEIAKTPQWREGPSGPKTLCNACGVRYRSGRLFPEYRPAASPTFVPGLRSNSHKKVLEMRNKATPHARKMDESRMLDVGI